jgi:hypothetical protein
VRKVRFSGRNLPYSLHSTPSELSGTATTPTPSGSHLTDNISEETVRGTTFVALSANILSKEQNGRFESITIFNQASVQTL